jgi:hypothetical protein
MAKATREHGSIATIDFEPINDHRPLLELLGNPKALTSLGATAQTAIGLLCLTKLQMVEIAATSDWFEMVDELRDAREILLGACQQLQTAEARAMVVAEVMAADKRDQSKRLH